MSESKEDISRWAYAQTTRETKCPKCGAEPGEYCHSLKGRKAERPHGGRTKAYIEAIGKEEYTRRHSCETSFANEVINNLSDEEGEWGGVYDHVYKEVVCTKCNSGLGEHCRTPKGREAASTHGERSEAYIKKIGIEELDRRHGGTSISGEQHMKDRMKRIDEGQEIKIHIL